MSEHPLDRPVWHSLVTRHAAFAQGGPRAKRFAPDVGPFAAACDDTAESLQALAELIQDGNVVILQVSESPLPPGTIAQTKTTGVQMVARNIAPLEPTSPIEPLTDTDVPEMMALAALTKPGPFAARTHRLGQFWGIKESGKLIAMAGERMKVEGFTEVSGVCTHPDHRGRGFAGLLSRTVAGQILARGETPFLHAYATNTAAISLYESLGFVLRCEVQVAVLASA